MIFVLRFMIALIATGAIMVLFDLHIFGSVLDFFIGWIVSIIIWFLTGILERGDSCKI